MATDYSDVDEHNKIKCLACLPDPENKATLWDQYIKKKDMTQEQFSYSSMCFYNKSDKEQCMEFAAKYLESIDMVKTSQHRDYAGIFFRNLSPSFLGKQEHLDKFREIHS